MDALYPLGGKQYFGSIELLFSLRMLEKFGEGIDNVFVIGADPGFLKNEAIPFEKHGVKNYRIAKKVEFACGIENLSEDFLFCNDDHFFMKPFVASEYPYYQKGTLEREASTQEYQQYLDDTANFLKKLGKPYLHYDVHCPIVYNKTKFLELSDLWNPQRELVVKSMYCNFHGLTGPDYIDHKLKHLLGAPDLNKMTENECFSVYDSAMKRGVLQYLCNNFGEPSRFEKEDIRFTLLPNKTFNDLWDNCLRVKRVEFEVGNKRAMDLLGKRPEMFKIIRIGKT